MENHRSEINSKNITLVLTHQCNLACTYCYEHHKEHRTMPVELAKKIVDEELTMDDGISMVEIDFFGGEPLLEYDTIREVVEYVKAKEYPKDYIFFITTNGVLLDDERKAWLEENSDYLQIGLSLDGTKEMHNQNRSDSFDDIDLSFFHRVYPEESVKMTISLETLPNLAQGVIFCHQQGFEVSCNLAYGIDWQKERNRKTFEQQLMVLIDYYLQHPDIKPCSLLDINRIKSIAQPTEKAVRYCGAGYAMRAYDCDGTVYPCQFFLPICVGEAEAKRALTIDFSNPELEEHQMDEACRTCSIRNVCPTCYGNNYATTGDIYKKDMRLCEMNRIHFKAIAFFAAKRFEAGGAPGFSVSDMAAILKAAISILQSV